MALQNNENYTDEYGNEYTSFYIKTLNVGLNTNNGEVFIHIGYFKNKTTSDTKKMSVKQYTNSFVPTDPNGDLRAQAYIYLKTLPEFQTAIDI